MRVPTYSLLSLAALASVQSVGALTLVAGEAGTTTSTATTTLVTTCSEVPVNQVTNGGFEDGSTGDWIVVSAMSSVVEDSSEAAEGSYYL